MPGHYQGPPKPPAPPRRTAKPQSLPPKKDIGFDEQNTEDAAGKRYNPFKGQKIKKDGKWVDRTPSNSPGGKP